jgi:hypothetical protein
MPKRRYESVMAQSVMSVNKRDVRSKRDAKEKGFSAPWG